MLGRAGPRQPIVVFEEQEPAVAMTVTVIRTRGLWGFQLSPGE